MTTRHTRQTFPIYRKNAAKGEFYEDQLVGIRVYGVTWSESLEACLGFLSDEDGVPDNFFTVDELEYLVWAVNRRLSQAKKLLEDERGT